MKIRTKLSVLISGCIIAVSIALGISAGGLMETHLLENVNLRLHESSVKAADKINNLLNARREILHTLSAHKSLGLYFTEPDSVDLMEIEDLLFLVKEQFRELALVDEKGLEIAKVKDGRICLHPGNLADTAFFREINTDDSQHSLQGYAVWDNQEVKFAFRVFNVYEEFSGFIIGTVTAESLLRMAGETSLYGMNNRYYVVDSEGSYVFHPDSGKIGEPALKAAELSRIIQATGGGDSVFHDVVTTNLDGVFCYVDYFPMAGRQWGVISAINQDGLVRNANRLKHMFLVVTLSVMAVGIVLALYVANSISRPIREMARLVEGFPAGMASSRVTVDTKDEIGQLADSFNHMVAEIKEARRDLEDKVNERTLKLAKELLERQLAEAALRRSEEKYRNLVESTVDWVWSTDAQGVFTFSNEAVRDLLGYGPEEIIGCSIFSLAPSEDRRHIQDLIAEAVGSKSGWNNISIRWIHKNRSVLFFESTARSVLDSGGRVVAISGINRDVTFQKKALEEKDKLEVQLYRLQKMEAIGTLAGGIAHDFNNILAIILGYTQLAMEDVQADSSVNIRLGEVIHATNRGRDLVRQILSFSRRVEQELRPIQPQVIVKETVKLLRATIPSSVMICQDIAPKCGTIIADPTQIHQVLMNLVTNAVHAMQEKGVLSISLKRVCLDQTDELQHPGMAAGPYVRLSVSDTGTGISPGIMEKIFDPFFTTKKVGEGTGMGLSVVHGIVMAHHGMITVESEPGKGSTFHVYFPVEEREETERVPVSDTIPGGSERILFIDDEAVMVEMWSEILKQLGYKVFAEQHSKKALERFSSQPGAYDLVITDQTMPDLTGVELAREMLRIRPDIPIILCTGYSSRVSREKACEMGIREFLMKPLDRGQLARVIRSILDRKTN